MSPLHYASSTEHILAELERIDLLVQVQLHRARQLHKADEEFQGLFIAEEEVNELIKHPAGLPRWATISSPWSQTDVAAALNHLASNIAERKSESVKRGIKLRFDHLKQIFNLSEFDADALLVCQAPELDLRYERLYAYLQDDVSKRRPSVDLVLNLLCTSYGSKLGLRQRFMASVPLFKYQLLNLCEDPSQNSPPLLSKFLKVDDRIVNYLLDCDEPDKRLLPHATFIVPQTRFEDLLLPGDVKNGLSLLIRERGGKDQGLVFYFQGPYGVGKRSTAEAICKQLSIGLLKVNTNSLLSSGEVDFRTALRLVQREAFLQEAAIYLDGFDVLLAEDKRIYLEDLLRELEDHRRLIFLAGDAIWEPVDAFQKVTYLRIEFPRTTHAERQQLWEKFLGNKAAGIEETDLGTLAGKFRFSGGQIRDAANTAANLALWRNPRKGQLTMVDLSAACRLQSNRKLAALAQKITPHYTWDDIVLPLDRLQQLREICNQVKYRSLVYDKWGFDRKLSLGKGLNILFAGPSGTGKTMAADVMAAELALDLYKIDLSTVVSKYIGETEKNLARIFYEAETSNSILFFDEADALFGKRSEVSDSHDRYANIEISYLLQRMEEYEGVVILATNLRKNMDDAFVRRMHFTVEFPFPEEKDRRRIWEQIWPNDTPRSKDLDLDFLVKHFDISGGNIRNVALAAAFMAADDGGVIKMSHLIRAIQREYQKMGKLMIEGEFARYFGNEDNQPATPNKVIHGFS